jgi:hypothetical protein
MDTNTASRQSLLNVGSTNTGLASGNGGGSGRGYVSQLRFEVSTGCFDLLYTVWPGMWRSRRQLQASAAVQSDLVDSFAHVC